MREPDPFRHEQEDLHTWREAAAFFAVCAALAESSGDLALVEMFRSLWERADSRADELDEAQLDEFQAEHAPLGELVRPPVEAWRRP